MKLRHLNDKNGFATSGLLLLMPLLLAVIATITAAFYLLKDEGQTRHICRTSALAMQGKVADQLNALIAMNPRATALRLDRQAAEDAVRNTAGIPYANAVAVANLNRVIVLQTLHAAKQKATIASAKHAIWLSRLNLNAKLRATLRLQSELQTEQENTLGLAGLSSNAPIQSEVSINTPEFSVEAKPQDSLTPDYEPADDFTTREALHVKWRLEVLTLLPTWMQNTLRAGGMNPHLNIDLGCGADVTASTDSDESSDSSPNFSSTIRQASRTFSRFGTSGSGFSGGSKWTAKLNQDR